MRNRPSSSPASATAAGESVAGGAKSTPRSSKVGLKKGPWTPEEDELLANYINKEGEGRWRTIPKRAGLLRCGKSCRLRWMNYLRPSVKRGHIAADEEDLILRLHRLLGNRWSLIAGRIPGRTDNEIKNFWNTHLSKKLISQGIDPRTHKPLISNVQMNHFNSRKQKDVSLSTSKPPAHPSPNQMHPTHNPEDGREDTPLFLHINKANNTTSGGFCFDSTTRNSTSYYSNTNINALASPCNSIINANHHHHHHLNFDGTTANRKNGSFEDQDQEQDPNYCNDDVFSSFLNSLINEEMFTSQSQQQLPRYDAGWDAPASAAGFHHSISPDDQPQ